jgi:hypothetical protein
MFTAITDTGNDSSNNNVTSGSTSLHFVSVEVITLVIATTLIKRYSLLDRYISFGT